LLRLSALLWFDDDDDDNNNNSNNGKHKHTPKPVFEHEDVTVLWNQADTQRQSSYGKEARYN
jgi:hypothetical protein